MPLYTVHVPETAADALAGGEATVLVREGVSLRAFLFGPFYLLWHRLWAALAAWAVLLGVLAALGLVFHPPAAGLVALVGLMHLYLGVEGPDLRRWGLARRGLAMRDVVSGPDLEAAEHLIFTRQPALPVAASPRPRAGAWGNNTPAVIGLFPDGDGA